MSYRVVSRQRVAPKRVAPAAVFVQVRLSVAGYDEQCVMADTLPRSNFNRRPHASIVAFAGCRVDGSRGSDYSPDRPSAAITDHLNVAYVIFFLLGAGTVLPPAPVGIRALCNADMPRPDHANPPCPCPHRPLFPSAPSDDSIARVRAYSAPPLPKRPSSACPEVQARRHMMHPSVSAVQVFPWNACAPQTPDCARLRARTLMPHRLRRRVLK